MSGDREKRREVVREYSSSISHCMVRSRPFSDLSTLERRLPSSSAPDWRTYGGGINLEGYCKNSSCQAYQRLVIMPLGYRTYRLSIDKTLCKCPACGERIKEEVTCGFHDAWYKYEGWQEVNGDSVEKKADWEEAPADAYYRFQDEGHMAQWYQLTIEAKRR